MKILLAASEVVPFAKTGGLADVAGALPLALEGLKHEIIVVMPQYRALKGKAQATIGKNIKVYFIKNEKFFDRPGLYGEKTGDYPDNLDRFSFFCKKVLELCKKNNFKPDIIHCHDWQSALIPVYLKALYKNDSFFKNTKTILTIHNIGYQGLFPKEEFYKLGLDWSFFTMDTLEFYDKINILKGGMGSVDAINTVSPTYSKEIMTREQGFGLVGMLQKRKDRVFGIINGLDYNVWDPARDKFLTRTYSPESVENKKINKQALQKECKLPVKSEIPLFGFVGRLAAQKGIDILEEAIEKIYQMDAQMVILGTGEEKYHTLLQNIATRYPKQVCLFLKFDDALAHRIYSGSDVFLMPSLYEPCGLGQMISFKYATPVIAHKTGGLADTVVDFDFRAHQGNGFIFDCYCRDAVTSAMLRAILAFQDKKGWQELLERCMKMNFSWQESGKKYIDLYNLLLGKKKK
jgi:starch synthase